MQIKQLLTHHNSTIRIFVKLLIKEKISDFHFKVIANNVPNRAGTYLFYSKLKKIYLNVNNDEVLLGFFSFSKDTYVSYKRISLSCDSFEKDLREFIQEYMKFNPEEGRRRMFGGREHEWAEIMGKVLKLKPSAFLWSVISAGNPTGLSCAIYYAEGGQPHWLADGWRSPHEAWQAAYDQLQRKL